MNLSDAIFYVRKFGRERQIDRKSKEALDLVLDVLLENVNVEEWDQAYYEHGAMCQYCSGNGCATCKGIGEAKIF